MSDHATHAAGTTMRRWMIAVGIFFLVLGIGLLPWVNDARIAVIGLDVVYTGGDLTTDDPAYHYVLDWAGVFGTTLLVLGGMLLVVARRPVQNRMFAHLVIWHELAAGVLSDAWFITRDDIPDEFYYGFIAVHLVVVATAIRALRRTPMPGAQATATAAATAEVG